jgi:hypothetical protein
MRSAGAGTEGAQVGLVTTLLTAYYAIAIFIFICGVVEAYNIRKAIIYYANENGHEVDETTAIGVAILLTMAFAPLWPISMPLFLYNRAEMRTPDEEEEEADEDAERQWAEVDARIAGLEFALAEARAELTKYKEE